jgi:predicted transcriptional regulator
VNPTPALPGGDLEYAVLVALWDGGPSRAREVHARVGESRGLAYTTIAKVLERLRAKKLVRRQRRGRSFLYRARVERADVERARVRQALSRLLGSAPRPAAATLVDAVEDIDPDLLEEMLHVVTRRRKRSRPGRG